VALTAVPNAGYIFAAWTGTASPPTSTSSSIVMSAPEYITANFQPAGQTGGILNGASFLQPLAAPNTILSLFGTNLECSSAEQLTVNGVQAPLLYSSATQMNFVVPSGLGGTGNAVLQLICNGVTTSAGSLALAPVNPAIFTEAVNGTGQGAVLNQNYTLNGPPSPVSIGGYILVYVTCFAHA